MSTVETWSIWMATLSFIRFSDPLPSHSNGEESRKSVKPPTQFLQQGGGLPAQRGIAQAGLDAEEALEGGYGGAPLVEPGIDLARLEQELRPVGRDRQHVLERAGRAGPVVGLGEPQPHVVRQPEQHVAVGHGIEMA